MIQKMSHDDIIECARELIVKANRGGIPVHMQQIMVMNYVGGSFILHDIPQSTNLLAEVMELIREIKPDP